MLVALILWRGCLSSYILSGLVIRCASCLPCPLSLVANASVLVVMYACEIWMITVAEHCVKFSTSCGLCEPDTLLSYCAADPFLDMNCWRMLSAQRHV
jgi:hypothetical protein